MDRVLTITYDRRKYRYIANTISQTHQFEFIQIIAKNKSIILRSNRPLLLSKGLKHRKVDWKIVRGDLSNSHFLTLIVIEIERHLR